MTRFRKDLTGPYDPTGAEPEGPHPPRAFRMRRSDFERNFDRASDPAPDRAAPDTDRPSRPSSTLTPSKEADLQAELTRIEAECPPPTKPAARPISPRGIAAFIAALNEERSPRPKGGDPTRDKGSAALDRLLQRTEADLADPHIRSRQAALTHLRAALAATEAARHLGEGPGTADPARPFRDDLHQSTTPLRLRKDQRIG